MHILRLSTVALTIVLFTMGALILPANTASAHCKPNSKGPHSDPEHFGCGGPPPPPPGEIIYTVEVVNPLDANGTPIPNAVAAFPFGPVEAALETETSLFLVHSVDLAFDRPGDYDDCSMNSPNIGIQEACEAWDAVFDQCTAPFDSGPPLIPSFEVSPGNASLSEAGDRTVALNGILLPTADDPVVKVWVHLIGPENTQEPFLPRDESGELSPGETRHDMVRVWFGGRTVAKGKKESCHPKGTGVPAIVDIEAGGEGTLVITATEAE